MKMENKMKNFRNRFFAMIIMLLFIAVPTQAQVFVMDEDQAGNIRVNDPTFALPVPYQGTSLDEIYYAPLGSGWLLLAGFGGYYLLKKRKEEDKQ